MKLILFATGNESKANRFSKGLLQKGIEVISLNDIDKEVEVEENGLVYPMTPAGETITNILTPED